MLLYLLSPDNIQKSDLGATRLGLHVPLYTGVCVELIMTFLLVLTVLFCADGNRKMSDSETALWSGLVIVGCHFAGVRTFVTDGLRKLTKISWRELRSLCNVK